MIDQQEAATLAASICATDHGLDEYASEVSASEKHIIVYRELKAGLSVGLTPRQIRNNIVEELEKQYKANYFERMDRKN